MDRTIPPQDPWYAGLTYDEINARINSGTAPGGSIPGAAITVPAGYIDWMSENRCQPVEPAKVHDSSSAGQGEDVYARRIARLRHLLDTRAPNSVIEDECRLVLLARYGSAWRLAVSVLRRSVDYQLRARIDTLQRALHRITRIHFRDEFGECWVCSVDACMRECDGGRGDGDNPDDAE